MKTTTEIVQSVIATFDEEVEKIPRDQYIEVMEELISDLEIKLMGAREEADQSEEE